VLLPRHRSALLRCNRKVAYGVRVSSLLLIERDAVLYFDFGLGIGISFGSAAIISATTEAPPRPQAGGTRSRNAFMARN
jgi:hypothetical protein